MRIPILIGLVVVGVYVAGCDEPAGPGIASLEPPAIADGTVRPTVVVHTSDDGITVITISIDAQALELGAYQGRFVFDPDQLEFVAASMPDDSYRVLNTLEATNGEIRFAGFTVERFAISVVVELRFRAKRQVEAPDVAVELEVVGNLLGQSVPRERIVPPSFRRVQP